MPTAQEHCCEITAQPQYFLNDSGAGSPVWYALKVRHNMERSAAAFLSQRGFDQFLPLQRSHRIWSDRIKQSEKPLFPGYVFGRFDYRVRSKVLATPGVIYIVSTGRVPAVVNQEELASIRTALESKIPLSPWRYVPSGTAVVVEKGPLRGVTGILEKIKRDHHLIISVSLLQRSVAIEMQPDWVRVPQLRSSSASSCNPGTCPGNLQRS